MLQNIIELKLLIKYLSSTYANKFFASANSALKQVNQPHLLSFPLPLFRLPSFYSLCTNSTPSLFDDGKLVCKVGGEKLEIHHGLL